MWEKLRLTAVLLIPILFTVSLQYEYDDYNIAKPRHILKNESLWELTRIIESVKWLKPPLNKTPCDGYYNYVCGHSEPLVSTLGAIPRLNELVMLHNELRHDDEKFDAKDKLMNFFLSCSKKKSVDDCHYEAFVNFRPVYGFIVTKKFHNQDDKDTLLQILENFIKGASLLRGIQNNQLMRSIEKLRGDLAQPHVYFSPYSLNKEFKNLSIYPNSYHYNRKHLEEFKKQSSVYRAELKTVLDVTIYLLQSRNKPRSYYYATLNVHLWMTFFNSTIRRSYKHEYYELAKCLNLPSYVNVLDEARNLTVIYFKSFHQAWHEYKDWIALGGPANEVKNAEIYEKENSILKEYDLSNTALFFIYYAQNFCEFGKEIAEHVFYQPLKQIIDFTLTYNCTLGQDMNPPDKCGNFN